ncbi:MAG: hypothetical protein Kow0075_08680 [Salibacteraceae bacterium]
MDIIKKAWFQILIVILGIVAVVTGITTHQNTAYMIGAFALLVAGIVSLISALTELSKTVRLVLSALLGVMVIGLAYADYMSIKVPIEFEKEKERRYVHVIQRLKDIRTAELAYKGKYQKYTGSLDTLENFIRYDSLPLVKAEGIVPDTMTLDEAIAAGIAKRDTVYVPVLDSLFGKRHSEGRAHPFVLDSLRYVPFTDGAEFELEAGFVERSSVKVPVFEARDSKPFDRRHVLKVGSMTEPKTNGNWE